MIRSSSPKKVTVNTATFFIFDRLYYSLKIASNSSAPIFSFSSNTSATL